jgi:hypothetical protein
MNSAGRLDTAATMHAMIAAVAGLSLAMVAPPGSPLAESVNQGLGDSIVAWLSVQLGHETGCCNEAEGSI